MKDYNKDNPIVIERNKLIHQFRNRVLNNVVEGFEKPVPRYDKDLGKLIDVVEQMDGACVPPEFECYIYKIEIGSSRTIIRMQEHPDVMGECECEGLHFNTYIALINFIEAYNRKFKPEPESGVMKSFIWINGKDAVLFDADSSESALTHVQNYSDHSKEVILREVESIDNQTEIVIKNQED